MTRVLLVMALLLSTFVSGCCCGKCDKNKAADKGSMQSTTQTTETAK